MNVKKMALGAYQTNCYLLWEGDRAAVIDPGYEPDTILRALQTLELHLEAILLTHGHFDHVGAVKTLASETDCRVYLCADDLSMPPMMTNGPLYYTHTYGEGDLLHLAGLSIRVYHTPGHTHGSVCFLCENALFSGDTLFAGSCGRTDLPGGDSKWLRWSLERLAELEDDYQVYPGHGESTTLAREKRYNPYMK